MNDKTTHDLNSFFEINIQTYSMHENNVIYKNTMNS